MPLGQNKAMVHELWAVTTVHSAINAKRWANLKNQVWSRLINATISRGPQAERWFEIHVQDAFARVPSDGQLNG